MFVMKFIKPLSVIILVLLYNILSGQDTSVIKLNTVNVVAKSNTQQIREGALSVSAIDVKPIINSLSNLNTLINITPGVKIREEGGVGSDFDLSINGMYGNSIKYFIDGIPMNSKGNNINLANLPINIVERIEIYKGVVPAFLGADALGGAINIVTKKDKKNYLDFSYGYGSFQTQRGDFNAQYMDKKSGIIFHPTFGISHSKNNYLMKGVEVWDEESRKYILADRRRFHDSYTSLLGQIEVGIVDKSFADELFISASYSKTDKELQTGAVQSKVYGMAERKSYAWNISANYQKKDFIAKGLNFSTHISHTWDYSRTIDTAYRKYDWNGDYIISSRNEITGRGKSLRHHERPLTVFRANFDYSINPHHNFNINYMLNRISNNRYDEVDNEFEAANDIITKQIIGLSYHQNLLKGGLNNTFFIKDFINSLNINQSDLYWQTGSDKVKGKNSKNYVGYGVASRLFISELLSIKGSFEHSIRLPSARELLGNGTTIYANVALKPENSNNINLGIYGNYAANGGHTFFYEATGFIRLVNDYIQATVSEKEGMMQYNNVPAVDIKGVEAEIGYNWLNKLQITLNANYQDARDKQEFKSDGKPSATFKNKVPNRPWLFGNANLSYTLRNIILKESKLQVGCSYNWVHWYFLTWEAYGSYDSKARIPTQNILNGNISYSWKKDKYNLALEWNNILDTLAYDNYKLQKPGRSFFLKFRLFIN